jgi:hypothetical protein
VTEPEIGIGNTGIVDIETSASITIGAIDTDRGLGQGAETEEATTKAGDAETIVTIPATQGTGIQAIIVGVELTSHILVSILILILTFLLFSFLATKGLGVLWRNDRCTSTIH